MHIMSDAQHVNLTHVLARMLTGERIDPQEIRECLGYLAADCHFLSCPFEQLSIRQLAEQVADAIRRDQL